jgi:hypothetical protein
MEVGIHPMIAPMPAPQNRISAIAAVQMSAGGNLLEFIVLACVFISIYLLGVLLQPESPLPSQQGARYLFR